MTDDDNHILVHRVGDPGPWTAPDSASYSNESHLQEVLSTSPHWVPGIPEGAMAVRELRTSAGPADVVIIAPDGALTVVECKLESNTERRRMVIGQLVDYAAALSVDGYDQLRTAWAARGGPDIDSALAPGAVEDLRSRIQTSTIGLCLAVDRIDADLRRLVEYLNRITRDQIAVTALQLVYARHGELEVLVPSTYGGEIASAKAAVDHQRRDLWNRESFAAALEDSADREFFARLLDRLDEHQNRCGGRDLLWCGTRPRGGLFFHLHRHDAHPPFQLAINSAGQLTVAGTWRGFKGFAGHPGFAELARMLGQDAAGPARFVPVAGLDPDVLWDVAERVTAAITS